MLLHPTADTRQENQERPHIPIDELPQYTWSMEKYQLCPYNKDFIENKENNQLPIEQFVRIVLGSFGTAAGMFFRHTPGFQGSKPPLNDYEHLNDP